MGFGGGGDTNQNVKPPPSPFGEPQPDNNVAPGRKHPRPLEGNRYRVRSDDDPLLFQQTGHDVYVQQGKAADTLLKSKNKQGTK